MDVNNNTGSSWQIRAILHDPKPIVGNVEWYEPTATVNIGPGTTRNFSNPAMFSAIWEDGLGNIISASALPPGLSWEIVTVAYPMPFFIGNPVIIQLGSGLTAPVKRQHYDQQLIIPSGCPANSSNQVIGVMSILGTVPNATVLLNIYD